MGSVQTVLTPDDAEEYTAALGQVFSGGWRLIHHAQRQGIPTALGMTTEEWVKERLGGYVRLSIPERREAVAELDEAGMSQREIAGVLGVSHKTVDRDLDVSNDTDDADHDTHVEDVGVSNDTDDVSDTDEDAQTPEAATDTDAVPTDDDTATAAEPAPTTPRQEPTPIQSTEEWYGGLSDEERANVDAFETEMALADLPLATAHEIKKGLVGVERIRRFITRIPANHMYQMVAEHAELADALRDAAETTADVAARCRAALGERPTLRRIG